MRAVTLRGIAIGVFGVSAALASLPGVAQQVTPGTVQDTLKPPPELERPAKRDAVDEPERFVPRPPPSDRTLIVERFEFGGNALYSSRELAALVAGYLGRPVTLLEIYDAADKVANFYVRQGYTLASVTVPAQRVADGVVRLEVVEGRYGMVRVDGASSYDADTVRRHLGDIPFGSPYKAGELQGGMRRLNRLPGLSAKAVLRPGETYGTSDVVVKVTETPVSGSFVVDNYGRENIGEFRVAASATFNNPTGVADQLQLLALRSEDGRLNYGYGAYSLPLNLRGDRLVLSHGYASFEVPENNVDGSNRASRIQVDMPIIANERTRFRISPAISRTDSTVDLFGVSTGLGTELTLFELGAQHLHPLKSHTFGFVRIHGVFSDDPLPDTERFSIGGPTSVRGYPASEARGDKGIFGTVGLRQVYRLGSTRLQGRLYADSGRAWLVGLPPGADDEFSLSSIGIGLDATMPGPVSLKLDYAVPTDGESSTRTVSDGKEDGRLFGSLTVGF